MAGRRPDFIAHAVVQAGTRSRWREVGVAFWNERKDTLTVLLDAMPLSGRIVLGTREVREREAEGRPETAEG